MNLDRMSRRRLLGTGALLTIEKAIGPTSAAQPVDTKEAVRLFPPYAIRIERAGDVGDDGRRRRCGGGIVGANLEG